MRKTLLLLTAAMAALTAVPAQAAQDSISVTVAYDCIDAAGNGANGNAKPEYPLLIGQDGKINGITYTAGQSSVIKVPAGTYDLHTNFAFSDSLRAKLHAHHAVVVKEGLNLTTDTTLTLSLKEAKHHIHFMFYEPDGKTAFSSTNVKSALVYCNLRQKAAGSLTNVTITGTSFLSQYAGYDVLASDLSSNYTFGIEGSFKITSSSDSQCFVGLALTGCSKSDTVANDASQYVTITDRFRLSPVGEASTYTGGGGMGRLIANNGGEWTYMLGGGFDAYPKRTGTATVVSRTFKLCDSATGASQGLLRSVGNNKQLDYGYYNFNTFPFKLVQQFTIAPPCEIIDGKPYVMVIGGDDNFNKALIGGRVNTVATPHPEFSYFKDQMGEDLLGNSVPVVNIASAVNKSTNLLYQLNPTFVGRYGENRGTDQHNALLTVALNDSVVSKRTLPLYIDVTALGKLTSGRLNVTLTDTNCVVDDTHAQNITTLSIDLSKAQRSVPTLQMLQLRNTATGKVTDRFDTNAAADEIRLAGASFYNEPTNNLQLPIAATMQVSYSPSGKDEWTPLEVTEEPANYRAIVFGNFYRGNLEQVNVPSDNKWYDLKVVITDENGNVGQQILKPAFKIENIETTGIASTQAAKAVQSVRYYDLTGRQSAEPTEGVNIKVITYTDGTTRSEKVMK